MKKLSAVLIAMFIVIAGANITLAQGAAEDAIGSYVVQIKNNVDPAEVASRHGLAPRFVYRNAVNGFAGTLPPGLLKKVQADPDVLSVSLDRKVKAHKKPDKPGKPGDGDGSSGQSVPAGLERIGAAPGKLFYKGDGVGVAIVDTGLDFNHADLSVASDCFTSYDSCQDDEGHGTHVGGIVAALNNSQDSVGVAPNAALYAVKVLDASGSGYDSDIIAGLDWIAANANSVNPPIRVANLSLGRPGSIEDNPAMHAAFQNLTNAGISVVTSAGNDQYTEVSQNIPAAYPEVMAIASTVAEDGTSPRKGPCAGALIQKDTASYFTTDGAEVAISAPGEWRENVKNSCTIVSEGILSLGLGGGTTRMSGTSMAAPYVAGVVALLYEKGGSLDPEIVRTALKNEAELAGFAPWDAPVSSYSYDGVREGVLSAPGALSALDALLLP